MSWRWWEQDGSDPEGEKKKALTELDREEEIGKEEGMPLETTTGQE